MPPKPASRPQTTKSARKGATKQPSPVSERLKRLFTSLYAQIDGGHFNNAIKTCGKILRLEPSDVDAVQTKLFLLLQTEQYSAALSLIGDDTTRYAFERAYSLYRLQREPDTAELLQAIGTEKKEARGVLHLQAQMNYRQGSYQNAVDIYNQLLDSSDPQSEEYSDIFTNLQASQKHLDFINTEFLRAINALPSSLAANLESSPPPQPVSSIAATLASSLAPPEGVAPTEPPSEKKKVRMARVPPGVVPGVTPPPDPERWLKKSERSTFTQGNKKRKGGGGGATQGSVEHNPAASLPPAKGGGGGHGKGKKKK